MLLNTLEKETRVKFNPGLSANRPSNNWAQVVRFEPNVVQNPTYLTELLKKVQR